MNTDTDAHLHDERIITVREERSLTQGVQNWTQEEGVGSEDQSPGSSEGRNAAKVGKTTTLERDKLRIEGESVDEDEKNTDGNKGPDEVFDRGESKLWLASSYLGAQGCNPRRSDEFCALFQKVWNEFERHGLFQKSKTNVTKHDDQSKEHHHEGANLDQSCRSAKFIVEKWSNEIRVNRKSTHVEIHDGDGTFPFLFNGEMQCTTDYTGHVLVEHGVAESVCRGSHVKRVISRMACGQTGNFPVDVVSKSFSMDTVRGCFRH